MIDIGRGTSMAHVMHWCRQRIPYVKTRLITKYFSERPWKNNNVGWYTVREKLFYIIDFTVHAAHGETPLNRHLLGEFSQMVLTSAYKSLSVGLPLCWKVFLEITTPHQQHWASTAEKSPTNSLFMIGWWLQNHCWCLLPLRSKNRGKLLVQGWKYISSNNGKALARPTPALRCMLDILYIVQPEVLTGTMF